MNLPSSSSPALTDLFTGNVKALASTIQICKTWRRRQQVIGFVNGCFDVLHAGHWRLLATARKSCDRLIVAVNTDEYCRKHKGDKRPIQPLEIRACVAGAVSGADATLIFSDDTPAELLRQIRPDIYFLGSDYRDRSIPGAHHCGKIIIVERLPGLSTTAIAGEFST